MNGPPLKFKAVNTETGEETNVVDYNLYLPPITPVNHELCQSTGLHDSKGQEIYCNDALLDLGRTENKIWYVKWDVGKGNYFLSDPSSNHRVLYRFDEPVLDGFVYIGNRYMGYQSLLEKSEQLEAKAREVLDVNI